MAQHDYNIANADGATVRADINSLMEAIASQNSGSTAPSVTFAFMPWFDTATDQLKIRNASNTAWVVQGTLVAGVWTPVVVGGLSQGKHQIYMPAAAGVPYQSTPAELVQQQASAYDNNYAAAFDAASDEMWVFQVVPPKSWDGLTLDIEIFWSPINTNTGNVVWTAFGSKSTSGGPASSWADTDSVTSAAGGIANAVVRAVVPQLTGFAAGDNDAITILVQRSASSGSDTYGNDARLRGIRVAFNITAENDA